ncbi:MAG: hypothetical protein LIO67_06680 [Lachnospiraceae bacterium]|nr:hypothetical protein [Lachnospiraceae bacterium]
MKKYCLRVRILSLLLSLTLAVSVCPATAYATEAEAATGTEETLEETQVDDAEQAETDVSGSETAEESVSGENAGSSGGAEAETSAEALAEETAGEDGSETSAGVTGSSDEGEASVDSLSESASDEGAATEETAETSGGEESQDSLTEETDAEAVDEEEAEYTVTESAEAELPSVAADADASEEESTEKQAVDCTLSVENALPTAGSVAVTLLDASGESCELPEDFDPEYTVLYWDEDSEEWVEPDSAANFSVSASKITFNKATYTYTETSDPVTLLGKTLITKSTYTLSKTPTGTYKLLVSDRNEDYEGLEAKFTLLKDAPLVYDETTKKPDHAYTSTTVTSGTTTTNSYVYSGVGVNSSSESTYLNVVEGVQVNETYYKYTSELKSAFTSYYNDGIIPNEFIEDGVSRYDITVYATGYADFSFTYLLDESGEEQGLYASLSADSFTYTGSAIRPTVDYVYYVDDSGSATRVTSYAVTYSNNINASTEEVSASVKVTASGKGTATLDFAITPKSLTDDDVTVTAKDVAASNNILPTVDNVSYSLTVKWGRITLTKSESSGYSVTVESIDDCGNVVLTLTGTGNYTGSVTATYQIYGKIASVSVAAIGSKAFTGAAIEPELVVYESSKKAYTLEKDKDYTVSYTKNTSVGTATVTITGMGFYTGTKNVTFAIIRKTLADEATVTVELRDVDASENDEWKTPEEYSVTYSASAQKPSVRVTYYPTEGEEGIELTLGTDYTLSYKNNTSAADYSVSKAPTVTVTGKGNYSGSRSENFTISQFDLTGEESGTTVTVADIKYTGANSVKPTVTVKTIVNGNEITLRNGTDYTVTNSYGYDKSEVSEAIEESGYIELTVKIDGKGNYAGTDLFGSYRVYKTATSSLIVVLENNGSMPWTGSEVKPQVTVYASNADKLAGVNPLKECEDGDYTVEYTNNTAVGTGKVTITGLGKYGGTKTVSFSIVRMKLDNSNNTTGYISVDLWDETTGEWISQDFWDSDISAWCSEDEESGSEAYSVTYNASAQKPKVRVTYYPTGSTAGKSIVLTEGTHYTVSYRNNINAADYATKAAPTVVVTGKGNYSGSTSVKFTIDPLSLEECGDSLTLTVGDVKDATEKALPSVTVKYGTKTLKSGTDYEKITSDCIEKLTDGSGNYSVTVNGKGNFTGSVTAGDYHYYGTSISSVKVSWYNAQTGGYTNTYTGTYTGEQIKPVIKLAVSGTDLTGGTDYELTYGENTAAGKGTIVIHGLGEYGGTKTVTFTISKKAVTEGVIQINTATYTGATLKPAEGDMTVTLTDGTDGTDETSGTLLEYGTDYTVSRCTNCVNAWLEGDTVNYPETKAPIVTITLKGNYSGTLTSEKGAYQINPRSLEDCTTTVSDVQITGKVTVGETKPTVTVKYGTRTLKNGTEYTIGDVTETAEGIYQVAITGTDNFTGGVLTDEFHYYTTAISNAKIKVSSISAQTYTGEQIRPEVTLTFSGTELIEGTHYELTYGENTAAGKGTVVIHGLGDYGGTRTVTFTIARKSLATDDVTVSNAQNWEYEYTGDAVKPEVVLTYGEQTLEQGVDYTLSYKNNTNVADSTAKAAPTIVITGKGNYMGSLKVCFTIYVE